MQPAFPRQERFCARELIVRHDLDPAASLSKIGAARQRRGNRSRFPRPRGGHRRPADHRTRRPARRTTGHPDVVPAVHRTVRRGTPLNRTVPHTVRSYAHASSPPRGSHDSHRTTRRPTTGHATHRIGGRRAVLVLPPAVPAPARPPCGAAPGTRPSRVRLRHRGTRPSCRPPRGRGAALPGRLSGRGLPAAPIRPTPTRPERVRPRPLPLLPVRHPGRLRPAHRTARGLRRGAR